MIISRRAFLKLGAGAAAGLYLSAFVGGKRIVFASPIPGGTLDPAGIPKFVTPLLIPPAMPRSAKLLTRGGKLIDYYEIAVRQFQQQILPAGLPKTTVWGYGPLSGKGGPMIFNAPSLTIEATWNTPVRIKWVNQLVDSNGNYLPHLLPVDPTLHWANPPGGPDGRDTRPTFTETPGPYTGPVPMVPHVHGSQHVGDESDGYAEAWYLPAANNIPAGYAGVGTWYQYFKSKAEAMGLRSPFRNGWEPGTAVFQYPNTQRASTIWYHDHSLGMTRLNVYAGPAGFFIVRGGPGDRVFDRRTGWPALLPGPAPDLGDPAGLAYHEIPLAIQDRAFNADGSLFYPNTRAFFDGITGPYIPETDISPIWNPEFFGNCMMVNGNTWPSQRVEQRRYRFRVLNGCNSRFLILDFRNIPGVEVWQIGNEGGFLAAPVNVTAAGNTLLMSPAERADVIVDFANVPVGKYVLGNVGPDEPFGGGEPDTDFDVADKGSTGQIMQFNVVPLPRRMRDFTTPPQFLRLPAIAPLPASSVTRPLALLEMMSMEFHDAPAEAQLGVVDNGIPMAHHWSHEITENPTVGATETWEFYNFTGDAHPMHIHEVLFKVVNRQPLKLNHEGEPVVPVELSGAPRSPEAREIGWKDTVIAYPGEVTRVQATFETAGQFVWHCHIVEHEDNEMMRPYRIGPAITVAPAAEADAEVIEVIEENFDWSNTYLPNVSD